MSLQYNAAERQKVLLRHIGMVNRALEFFPAESYKRIGIEREDLFQEGCVALVQAMERFDPSKKVAFSSFVFRRIRGAMIDYVRQQQVVSRNILEKKKIITQISSKYYQQFERAPNEKELTEELSTSVRLFRQLLVGIEASGQILDLDHTFREDDEASLTIGNKVLTCEDKPMERVIISQGIEIMNELLSQLTEREQQAIHLFYFRGRLAADCAQIMSMNPCTSYAFRVRILKKLRVMVEEMDSSKRSVMIEAMREMRG